MGNKRLNLRLSDENYERIKANSQKLHMTMNAFVTKSAVEPVIIRYDYDAVKECTKALSKIKLDLYWLLASENLSYPNDIQAVLSCTQNINDTMNALLKQTRNERKSFERALKHGKYDHLLLRKDTENV